MDGLQGTASRGVKIVADTLISECADKTFDLIALPGGMPGAEHPRDSRELAGLLKKQQMEKRLYGAICAAPFIVLQHHGLLDGRGRQATRASATDSRTGSRSNPG